MLWDSSQCGQGYGGKRGCKLGLYGPHFTAHHKRCYTESNKYIRHVSTSRKMEGQFKLSQLATSLLKDLKIQLGMKTTWLQQDKVTWWNSTFYMLWSVLEQKQVLAAYGVNHALPASLSIYQWVLTENMLTIFDLWDTLTRDSSATSTAALKHWLNKTIATDQGVKNLQEDPVTSMRSEILSHSFKTTILTKWQATNLGGKEGLQ